MWDPYLQIDAPIYNKNLYYYQSVASYISYGFKLYPNIFFRSKITDIQLNTWCISNVYYCFERLFISVIYYNIFLNIEPDSNAGTKVLQNIALFR